MKDAKNSRLRLVLGSLILLVVAVGLVGLMEFSDRGNESPEQTMPEDEIYVCIPRRFGAVDQDPHWWTSVAYQSLNLSSIPGARIPERPATCFWFLVTDPLSGQLAWGMVL
jgi:hypothetical protein